MDWTGQMHAEWVYQIIILLFTLVGFVYAYAEQDFTYCVHGWLAGLLLSSVVVRWKCLPAGRELHALAPARPC